MITAIGLFYGLSAAGLLLYGGTKLGILLSNAIDRYTEYMEVSK